MLLLLPSCELKWSRVQSQLCENTSKNVKEKKKPIVIVENLHVPYEANLKINKNLKTMHLRCDVIRRPAEGGGGEPVEDSLLAHPEVRQFAVTLRIQ